MQIALIGGGPRGLLVLARLLALKSQSRQHSLMITLFEPYPLGGRVWQITQDPHLIMNTPAQQITLFYDQSVQDPGPITAGPNLAQWAQDFAASFLRQLPAFANQATLIQEIGRLKANDYASRALYGAYCQWFAGQLQLPEGVSFEHVQSMVQAVRPNGAGYFVSTKMRSEHFDAVVMALGNIENSLTRQQQQLADFAKENQLFYLPPNFPAEGDLSAIKPGSSVIIRGLGLSFFDFVSRLTQGRGGYFSAAAEKLSYHPSGLEPHITAGSRRGFPYHAKGLNQKAPGEQTSPHFLTRQQLANWQRQRPIAFSQFLQALQHEAAFTYYSLLLKDYPQIDLPAFQADFLNDPEETLARLPIKGQDRLDWQTLSAPAASTNFINMKHYLSKDIQAALLGTKTGPVTAALEVLRDLRDPIRQVLALGLLSDDDYLDFFLRSFNGTNNFLSIGPPVLRIQQLLALIEAGIVTLLAPDMQVTGKNGKFAASDRDQTAQVAGTALIEARVPAVNAPTAQSPLIQQLLHDDLAGLYELQLAGDKRFQSGAILTDPDSCLLVNSRGQLQPDLYFWGVPTEGANWLTSASPRPHVGDISLRLANHIAREILKLV